jgi:hypothetical protein
VLASFRWAHLFPSIQSFYTCPDRESRRPPPPLRWPFFFSSSRALMQHARRRIRERCLPLLFSSVVLPRLCSSSTTVAALCTPSPSPPPSMSKRPPLTRLAILAITCVVRKSHPHNSPYFQPQQKSHLIPPANVNPLSPGRWG